MAVRNVLLRFPASARMASGPFEYGAKHIALSAAIAPTMPEDLLSAMTRLVDYRPSAEALAGYVDKRTFADHFGGEASARTAVTCTKRFAVNDANCSAIAFALPRGASTIIVRPAAYNTPSPETLAGEVYHLGHAD